MKNKPEEIPAELFDWLKIHSFDKLTATQKKTVLEYFSEAEYDEMFLATGALHRLAMEKLPRGKERIKAELLETFDRKKASWPKSGAFIVQLGLGKVAALALLFVSLLALQHLYFKKEMAGIRELVNVDTLLVEAEPLLIRDTVVLREEKQPTPKRGAKYRPGQKKQQPFPEENELYIAKPDELDHPINRSRQNSLGQDSLISKYGFVSM